jgi:SAM-dependent methyltransferase
VTADSSPPGGLPSPARPLFGGAGRRDRSGQLQWRISEHEDLLPPPLLMLEEAEEVLEDWFAGGAEQATLARTLAEVRASSTVLEIGCGLGRMAFALRRLIITGRYIGVDVVEEKIAFLRRTLGARAANFAFVHLDAHNGFYNPTGHLATLDIALPCSDGEVDAVVSMAVFTHLLPENVDRYVSEITRVLRPGGRALLSCYLLDHYDPDAARPPRYSGTQFAFDHAVAGDAEVRTSCPEQPEAMTAFTERFLLDAARRHGLHPVVPALPGSWSGATDAWLTGQDLVILERQ